MQIGLIDLTNFELPPSIRFGGNYRTAVHKSSSGERIIEQLGPDEEDIWFEGVLSGSQAEQRARALDILRLSGETVWLTWESFRYQVVVKSLSFRYHSPWWIEYKACCLIAVQPGVTAAVVEAGISLVMASLNQAKPAAANCGIVLTELEAALFLPNVMTAGSANQSAALTAAGRCSHECMKEVVKQSARLSGPTASNPMQILNSIDSAGLLAAAVCTKSQVSRIYHILEASAS